MSRSVAVLHAITHGDSTLSRSDIIVFLLTVQNECKGERSGASYLPENRRSGGREGSVTCGSLRASMYKQQHTLHTSRFYSHSSFLEHFYTVEL